MQNLTETDDFLFILIKYQVIKKREPHHALSRIELFIFILSFS
ncbi:hypothetical protein BAXH7_02530 [Bacillus amyloliquefaciens XH7]|nr:hypothetical protein LL3_02607 [Bacillus amyloliquefaciens LL3]AEK89658.1 hypothetical protein BAXH7_02530 [Bacillus amyloliquefaciens XH7]KYC95645.1 hypothetical protein B425_2493 [Bacillus amyloliquefaciens]